MHSTPESPQQQCQWIGVDVSRDKLDVYDLSDKHYQLYQNNPDGIEALCQRLLKHPHAAVVCESTGGYELAMASRLNALGIAVSIVNPRPVKDLARALNKIAKTDAIDAYVLARYGAFAQPAATVFATQAEEQLKQWVVRRQQLVEMLSAEKNRRVLLRGLAKDEVEEHIEWLDQKVKQLDKKIEDLSNSTQEWKAKKAILRSPKGIGPHISASFLILIPELGQLNRKQIAALAGLAPYNRDSGRLSGQRHIWGGRGSVRALMYLATLSALRSNPPIRAFYQHLLKKGKAKKVAIVACMRKFLICLNAMVRKNEPWDDNKVTAFFQST